MLVLRTMIALAAAGFVAAVIWAFGERPIGESFAEISADPWGIVTLIDLYLGFGLFAVVIALTERRVIPAAVWILPLFVLGNAVAAAWLIFRLGRLATGPTDPR